MSFEVIKKNTKNNIFYMLIGQVILVLLALCLLLERLRITGFKLNSQATY